MHISVGHVFQGELATACSEVSLCVPVALQISADGTHHGETTDVELPVLVKQRLFDVFLNNIGPFVAIYNCVLN
jgi:hypothetical protein